MMDNSQVLISWFKIYILLCRKMDVIQPLDTNTQGEPVDDISIDLHFGEYSYLYYGLQSS